MSTSYTDPRWPRAGAWLAGTRVSEPIGSVAILGAPANLGSITPGTYDEAPDAIRAALSRFSSYDLEFDNDLGQLTARDLGDLPVADIPLEDARKPIREAVADALRAADAAILLGGNNGVTRPACHGLASPLDRCGLVTLDAQLDLRDLEDGQTNENHVRALLADGLPGRHVVQIGIQSFVNSRDYAQLARDAGITVITREQVRARGIVKTAQAALNGLAGRVDAIYVDFDLAVLDRAYAPAAPAARPGGLTALELRLAARVCGMHPKVRAIDLVEIDPSRDMVETTSLAAAACLLSFASGLLLRLKASRG